MHGLQRKKRTVGRPRNITDIGDQYMNDCRKGNKY